jgi:hypothetical protein
MIPTRSEVPLAFAAWFAAIAIIFALKGDTRIWSLPFVLVAATLGRSAATPLPGTRAEFCLLNHGRTVAVRSAGSVATVAVSGRGAPRRPELLTELAAKIAARLDST